MGNYEADGFKTLRTGFIFSLLALCLLLLMGIGFHLSYAFTWSVSSSLFFVLLEYDIFPFASLFCWLFGADRRVQGWNQLGQKTIAGKLSICWKINFFFIIPLPFIVLFLIFFLGLRTAIYFLISPFALLLWGIETSVIWGYSTAYEVRGLKKLEEEKKVRLSISRNCSSAAIMLYAIFVGLGYVAFATQSLFSVFLVFAFLPFYFSVLSNAILLISPLLIISCINAIIQLKHVSVS